MNISQLQQMIKGSAQDRKFALGIIKENITLIKKSDLHQLLVTVLEERVGWDESFDDCVDPIIDNGEHEDYNTALLEELFKEKFKKD